VKTSFDCSSHGLGVTLLFQVIVRVATTVKFGCQLETKSSVNLLHSSRSRFSTSEKSYSYTCKVLLYYLNRASPRGCAPLRVQFIAYVWRYLNPRRVECSCALEYRTNKDVTLLNIERFLKRHPLVGVALHLDSFFAKRWGSLKTVSLTLNFTVSCVHILSVGTQCNNLTPVWLPHLT
jgi:hypothetical protein